MYKVIQILTNKYPSLLYFDITQIISEQQLLALPPEVFLPNNQMTTQAKHILKIIRKFATQSQNKLKLSRNLYRQLKQGGRFIQSIILNNSRLKSLQPLENQQLHSLIQLQLSSNEIKCVIPLSLMKTPALQQLDLSSNKIEDIRGLINFGWTKLRELNLSQNSITSVEGLAFHKLTSLKILNLSDNFLVKLKTLRKQFCTELRQLRQLNLANNELIELNWLSQCLFWKLEKLDLRNNRNCGFLEIEKVRMKQEGIQERLSNIHYEILLSSLLRCSSYVLGYRQLSGHKLSIKISGLVPRSDRKYIQKSRKLILYENE